MVKGLKFLVNAVSQKAGSVDVMGRGVGVEVRCWTVFGFFFVAVSAYCSLLGCNDFKMAAISLFVGGIDGGGNLGKVLGMSKMLRPE